MKEETGYFSSFDGTKLFYRAWEKDASNAVIIIHGFGEHSGRYHELVSAFDSLPISIFTFDLRGHGRSEGERVCTETFENFVDDLYQYHAFLEARRAGAKRRFILLGQSLGGLIATASVLRKQDEWRALILLSPFFGIPLGHQFLHWLSELLSAVSPKTIWRNPIRPIFLTHDLEQLEQYRQDPLIQRRITLRMAREMFRGCASVWTHVHEITLPLLFLASGDDRIVSVKKSKEFFEQVASTKKEFQIFDGYYHELLHEVNREKPISVLKNFLNYLNLC